MPCADHAPRYTKAYTSKTTGSQNTLLAYSTCPGTQAHPQLVHNRMV